jgi:hypothetical protein
MHDNHGFLRGIAHLLYLVHNLWRGNLFLHRKDFHQGGAYNAGGGAILTDPLRKIDRLAAPPDSAQRSGMSGLGSSRA